MAIFGLINSTKSKDIKKDPFLEVENEVKSEIQEILKKRGTYVSMAPLSSKYFIINKIIGCTILISGDGFIKIANHDFKYGWQFRDSFINEMISLATDWIEKDRAILEEELFNNEMSLLKKLKEKIASIEDK